jgi:hypothetical protein
VYYGALVEVKKEIPIWIMIGPNMPESLSPREQFYMKEYDALRKEVDAMFADARALERYGLVAVAGVWGWLVQQSSHPEVKRAWWAWWVPVVVAALCLIRSCFIGRHFRLLSLYIKSLEYTFLGDQTPKGWETSSPGKDRFGHTATLFWSLLFIATIAVAIIAVQVS